MTMLITLNLKVEIETGIEIRRKTALSDKSKEVAAWPRADMSP